MKFKNINSKETKEFIESAEGDTKKATKKAKKSEKKILPIVFSEVEYHLISAKAQEESMPISTFVRSSILKMIRDSWKHKNKTREKTNKPKEEIMATRKEQALKMGEQKNQQSQKNFKTFDRNVCEWIFIAKWKF